MRRFALPLAFMIGLLGQLTCRAGAQSYCVHLSCRATIALPSGPVAQPIVYIRHAGVAWHPADFQLEDGRIVITLDPAKLGGGRALLLINPPEDMDIHDARPPRLLQLQVDGETLDPRAEVSLGASSKWPRRVDLTVADSANALDLRSVRVSLDGDRISDGIRVSASGPRSLKVRAKLPKVDYGDHVIRYSIADASPQANRLLGEISFGRYDMTNFVLAAHGTELLADSHFIGYDSLACLQDGDVKLPGHTLPGSISWASAETNSPHWVEVQFGRRRTIKEVTIYWANYTHELHTSKAIEIQIPEGDGWNAVYESLPEGEKESVCTTAEFAPVTVTGFRVYQPAGAGSPSRPDLMWLAEIEAR